MPAELLILPSPLLPAMPYQPLLRALTQLGHACVVAPSAGATTGRQLIDRWSELVTPTTTLLAHSNAGYLAPGVRAAAGTDSLVLFMDAALPPANGDTALAPAALRERLAAMADLDTGVLPPWTRWWPRAQMLPTVPADQLDAIDAECPRMPLSYFDSRVRAPDRWVERPNAYLAFGTTYADEVGFARGLGWSTRTVDGGHLEFLHDPGGVADQVTELLRRAG